MVTKTGQHDQQADKEVCRTTCHPRRMHHAMRWAAFFLFFIVCLGCWTACEARRAASQEAAVKSIEKLGGHVCLSYQSFRMDFCPAEGAKPLPSLIYRVLGDHFYVDVKEIVFYDCMDDARLTRASLQHFPKLQRLTLVGPLIGGDLSELADLPRLVHLELRETPVSDQGLDALSKLNNLRTLVLPSSVDEERIRSLATHLPQCNITQLRGNVMANPKRASLSKDMQSL